MTIVRENILTYLATFFTDIYF